MDSKKEIQPTPTLADEIKKRLPFTSASEEAYLNLLRTHAQLIARTEAIFKQYKISPPKYNILRILRGSQTGTSASCISKHGLPSLEIADQMITRVPDITRLVDGLEQAGLVARTRCTQDRRVVYVGITRKGLDLLSQLDKPVADLNRQILGHMTEAELTEFNRLLVKARNPK